MPKTLYSPQDMDIHAILRGAMARCRVRTAELTNRLQARGIPENERNLRNKIARGTMSAKTFLLCLDALEVNLSNVDGQWIALQRAA